MKVLGLKSSQAKDFMDFNLMMPKLQQNRLKNISKILKE